MLKKLNNIEKAIFRTIVYYDIFDYPLTIMEIWQWLFKYKCKLSDIVFCLNNSENLKRYLETRNGFYFLKGRKELLITRKLRRDYSVDKWRKVLKGVKFLRFIPFIKMIALCNSIGHFNIKENGDIDLFIVIKDKYLWLTRFLITVCTQLLGIRRHGKKIKDRLCLSFYITDKQLGLEGLTYKNDIYFYYWLIHLIPVFDNGVYKKFFKANNWVKEYIPQVVEWEPVNNWIIKDTKFSKFIRVFKEKLFNNFFGRFLNLALKKIQLFKMSKNKHSKAQEDNTDVVISDGVLKFHETDTRKYYKNIFFKKISNF